MQSIQVIRLLDVLDVTGVSEAHGVSPRSLVVHGVDFNSVETVLINDISSPAFVVYSTSELIAEVPQDLRQSTISQVTVLSSALTLTPRSFVELTFGTRPKKTSGVVRLMQVFVRMLLRTPGSNIFHKKSGGGLLRRIGTTMNTSTAADIALAIASTRQYIIGVQTPERNIPASERLLSAEITGLSADPRSTEVQVTVVLTSHAGQRSAATLVA